MSRLNLWLLVADSLLRVDKREKSLAPRLALGVDRPTSVRSPPKSMAVIGTTIAVVLSFPIALGAARNTTPHPVVMAVCRGIIVLSRAVPDLIFAAIFVRAIGIGVLPGVIALGLHSIGMIGKLFADAIEQTDKSPREAVTSVGASKWQAIRCSLLSTMTQATL